MAISNSYRASLREMNVQVFTTGPGTNHNFFSRSLGAKVGRNATGAIAGDLCFGSVGIEEAGLHVGVACGKQPLDAVGTYALMPVADAATECGQVRRDRVDHR